MGSGRSRSPRHEGTNVQAGTAADALQDTGVDLESCARVIANPLREAKPQGWTRFVCFSDTHGLHDEIPEANLVEGDVLLHAGDFSNTGEAEQVSSFAEWLRAYPARYKVVIAGNHDVTFHPGYYQQKWSRYHRTPYDCEEARRPLLDPSCCTYLEDAAAEVLGYKIYGSPWQPFFCDWAFNLKRGEPCLSMWKKIPVDVDILMTHGPPLGFGDLCSHGARAGCEHLSQAVKKRTVPLSVAGHIHEGYGAIRDGATLYVNASTCTSRYQPSNPPIVIDLPPAAELRDRMAATATLHRDKRCSSKT